VADAARAEDRPAAGEHQSAGRRLLAAFEAFERFPAFEGARRDVIDRQGRSVRGGGDVVSAVESDLALTVAVLRRANDSRHGGARVASVPEAVARIGEAELRAIVENAPSFGFFEHSGPWGRAPENHRLHALATQRAAARLARTISVANTDELLTAALLHDIGKLVLLHANSRYTELATATATPEQRVQHERRTLGVDHALVGGVLARRWGLPHELAHAIERHHHPHETGLAGLVRLADMLAHYEAAHPVDGARMRAIAAEIGLSAADLHSLLTVTHADPPRPSMASPLTPGEHKVIRELAKGHVYKEIAETLGLSPSTVRTHLHNIYNKLGVSDRAQAILLAKEQRWI
jgi:putative nucleotidyltransferase with HDIG domain